MSEEKKLSSIGKSDRPYRNKWFLLFVVPTVAAAFFLALTQTHFLSNVVKNENAGKVRKANFGAYPKTLWDAILTDKDIWIYVDHGYIRAALGQELTLITYDSGLIRLCSNGDESECSYVRRTCVQDVKTQLPGACVSSRFPLTHKFYQSWIRPFFGV